MKKASKTILTTEGLRSYDWIDQSTRGKYLLTQEDGRFGILKRGLEHPATEILQPSAICQPNLVDLYRYGITSVQFETEAVLMDSTGRFLQEGCKFLIFCENLVGILTEENKFKLYNPLNGHISDEYDNFEIYKNFIVTFENEMKGLLTRNLVEVFKPEFQSVGASGSCFTGEHPDGTRYLGHPNWDSPIKATNEFSEANGFILMRMKRYAFIEVETGKRTQFIFPRAENFSKEGYAKVEHPLYGPCWMDKSFKVFLPAREE